MSNIAVLSITRFYVEVQTSLLFLLADGSQDVLKMEQLTIVVRDLDKQNAVKEDFIGFVDAYEETTSRKPCFLNIRLYH